MKHVTAALTTALISGLLMVGFTAAPAAADGRRCVSEAEYQEIRWQSPPATAGRVHDHFDTSGVIEYRNADPSHQIVLRSYVKCPEWNRGRGRVQVWFDNYSWDWRMRVYAIAPNGAQNWAYPG